MRRKYVDFTVAVITATKPLTDRRLFSGKIAPARHALDADGNDRELAEFHPAILRVARPEQRLRPVVLGALRQDLGRAPQHDPAEPGPVLVIAIGDKRGDRIFDDVSEALQRPR